jgi:hypothetical protein
MTYVTLRSNLGFWVAVITLIATLLLGIMGVVDKDVMLVSCAICSVGLR